METSALKAFAGDARRQLLSEVRARLELVLAEGSTQRREFGPVIAKLEAAIDDACGGEAGRVAVVDRVAYTWFNRIIALRFMDANSYTGIGVVSPSVDRPDGQPEVLVDAKRGEFDADVVAPADAQRITGLLNGSVTSSDPESEAFGLLLAAYCRFWNKSMPFMFEQNSDYTELLMPSDLLSDESVIARAVAVLTPDVCADVEVIGWLYQFYIAERKDEVFAGFKKGKKAGAAEIPAATQLFTPDWIVRYLVENSLGRLWLLNRPDSTLVDRMDYYIAPVDEETDFLRIESPEEIKVMDPACGSGHMLTYAFDLLYAMYEEDGYNPVDIPALILSNNLFGTEIDPRAGALAAFALTMKARGWQRTYFSNHVVPNICVLVPVIFTQDELDELVSRNGDAAAEEAFFNAFAEADTLGALIRPQELLLARLKSRVDSIDGGRDLFGQDVAGRAQRVVEQSEYLTSRYHVVVANPPYMGSGNMSSKLSTWCGLVRPLAKQNLYALFIDQCGHLVADGGDVAMITMDGWMFQGRFEAFRESILTDFEVRTMAHLGPGAFETIGGEVVSTTAFVASLGRSLTKVGCYFRLTESDTAERKKSDLLSSIAGSASRTYWVSGGDFLRLPTKSIAYWAPARSLRLLAGEERVGDLLETREGMATGNNELFLRLWWEVSASAIATGVASESEALGSDRIWFPYVKGGGTRRWYGNTDHVVNWGHNGAAVRSNVDAISGRVRSHNYNGAYAFREGLTWSGISTGRFGVRHVPVGFMFDAKGPMGFSRNGNLIEGVEAFLNSAVAAHFMSLLAPTLDFKLGHVLALPVVGNLQEQSAASRRCVEIAKEDWDEDELSWDFLSLPLFADREASIAAAFAAVAHRRELRASRLAEQESEINAHFISAYGLGSVLSPIVSPNEVGLRSATVEQSVRQLVSFGVGCIFGRYSLDMAGTVLANQGETLEDFLARVPEPSFLPDEDNVLPVLADDWFDDDIVERFRLFLRVAFGEEHFEENLRFVEESLGKDIRRYFLTDFYKDHVQRFKKRPIYWMFSSPKGTFNALIYMHRYNPSTVSTVLNEYLREFQAKLEAELTNQGQIAADPSTPTRDRARAEKESDRLRKMIAELKDYERDVLYPLASQQISIDLDDGVKANYPKFGAALKKIPGLEAASD